MEINKISDDTQKSMKQRIITGIILAIIVFPCVILGDWFFIPIVAFVVGFGLYEAIKATGKKYPLVLQIILYVLTYSFTFWVFFQKGNAVLNPAAELIDGKFLMYDVRISTMGVGVLVAILFFSSIVSQRTDLQDIFYLFMIALLIGFSGQALLFLRYCPEGFSPNTYPNSQSTCVLLFFVAGGTMLTDICAYFVGVLFGKHKMAPVISPKKTWEGFFGGVILASVIMTVFALMCDMLFNNPILKGMIDCEHWYFVIILSVSICLASVLGDLMFSSIKRFFNIKDFGKIFPGHGGVLDRFDSILMTSILSSIVIIFIHYDPIFGVIS